MLLKLDKISKSYHSEKLEPVIVLNDIDFELAPEASCVIAGPSGSGKSTLLNIIGGLSRPDKGKILFKDTELASLSNDELARHRNRSVGFIFQQHHLLPQLSVVDNVLLPTIPFADKNLDYDFRMRALELLDKVGLSERTEHHPGQLSGGECQRVAVIRALINNPDLLLADEPTGALDSDNSARLTDLLIELNESEKTALIIVTHSAMVAEKFSNHYNLINGTLEASPPADD